MRNSFLIRRLTGKLIMMVLISDGHKKGKEVGTEALWGE